MSAFEVYFPWSEGTQLMIAVRRFASVLALVFCLSAFAAAGAWAQFEPPRPPEQQPDGPMLGIQMSQEAPGPGIHIVIAIEGGPAEAAGLQPRDVLLKLDGRDLVDFKSLQSLLPTYNIGDTVELVIQRGTETVTTKLKLGSRKAIQEADRKRNLLVDLPVPPIAVSEWVNGPFDPATQFKGKVTVIHFFEMLCAGSLGYSLPRITEWVKKYGPNPAFAAIGIHSVWELHDRQTPEALKEFLARREIKYPVGIDKLRPQDPRGNETLWNFRIANEEGRLSTPGTVIVDKQGIVRFKKYGNIDPTQLVEVEKLIDQLLAAPADGGSGGGSEPGK